MTDTRNEIKDTDRQPHGVTVKRLVITSFCDLGMRSNGKYKSKYVLSDGQILFSEVDECTPPEIRLRYDKSAMVKAGVSKSDFEEFCGNY